MTFEQALEYIYSFKDWERGKQYKFDLAPFFKLLDKIGSPHTHLKYPILIGGTKGKGSTANILSAILQRAGKIGLYTSPHLVDIRERIKINNTPIPVADFIDIIALLKPYLTKEYSTFEILTAVALTYFVREQTDFSVLEVGLGGRLDATNAVEPKISVLTPISFDHTEVLGETLIAIANEKCGIIREQGKVVSAPQDPEIMKILKGICISKQSRLWTVGEDLFCDDVKCDYSGSLITIGNNTYFLPLLGRHQVINALTAICTAKVSGISEDKIVKGVAKAKSPGRLEIISQNPWVILDGAHNVASAWVLRRAIVELFKFKHLFLVFAVLKDKDKQGMIEVLAPITDYAIVVPLKSERACLPEDMVEIFNKFGVTATISETPLAGLQQAQNLASPTDIVLSCGSLYLVGELLASLKFHNTGNRDSK